MVQLPKVTPGSYKMYYQETEVSFYISLHLHQAITFNKVPTSLFNLNMTFYSQVNRY